MSLFADAGRGWNNGEHSGDRPLRKDAGLGVEFWFNLLKLTEFPIRIDVAYPINDPDFDEPQIIAFGIFRF